MGLQAAVVAQGQNAFRGARQDGLSSACIVQVLCFSIACLAHYFRRKWEEQATGREGGGGQTMACDSDESGLRLRKDPALPSVEF